MEKVGGWHGDPCRGSLGLLPSGPDPVGEWLVHHQPPGFHIGNRAGNCKGGIGEATRRRRAEPEQGGTIPSMTYFIRNGRSPHMPGTRYMNAVMGVTIGLAVGAVLGVSVFENLVLGIVLGIFIGAGIGSSLPANR
jgi:hypothetical protein